MKSHGAKSEGCYFFQLLTVVRRPCFVKTACQRPAGGAAHRLLSLFVFRSANERCSPPHTRALLLVFTFCASQKQSTMTYCDLWRVTSLLLTHKELSSVSRCLTSQRSHVITSVSDAQQSNARGLPHSQSGALREISLGGMKTDSEPLYLLEPSSQLCTACVYVQYIYIAIHMKQYFMAGLHISAHIFILVSLK